MVVGGGGGVVDNFHDLFVFCCDDHSNPVKFFYARKKL
jgi:hypothetical protein